MSEGIKVTKLEFSTASLEAGLNAFRDDVNEQLHIQGKEVAELILLEAKNMCPVDTGTLRNSGFIEEVQEGVYKVGFSAPYAKIVHEKPDGWQKSGETQFLAKAIRDVCGENNQKLKRWWLKDE